MVTINILNERTYIFLLIFIIGIIVLSIYMMIKPENATTYRFNPFPQQTPTDLPDPSRATDSCWNKLTPCDSFGNCSACSLSEYKCTNVSKDEADKKFYHFNGINVPEGQWCLPKDNNPNPACNQVTGRWVWTFDQDYCSSIDSGSQCWKCECLYPNFFSGSEEGCTTPIACQNDSIYANSSGSGQPENKLIASPFAPKEIQGCEWNPNKDTVPGCEGVYNYSPYDQNKSGEPYFQCSCSSSENQYFTRLPGDPYTCHLDPCYSSKNYTSKGYSANNNCLCSDSQSVISDKGKFENTCVSILSSCGESGGWDESRKSCLCQEPFWARDCKNPVTQVNMDKDVPNCLYPQNALGSECFNPCAGKICNHKGTCISCGPNSYLTVPECRLNGDSSIMTDKEAATPHSFCDCSLAGPVPSPPPGEKTNYAGYYGPSCAMLCLGGGTVLNGHILWSSYGNNNCSCCCSLDYHTENDAWIFSSEEVCNDGFPSINNPPNSDCLPLPDQQCPDQS